MALTREQLMENVDALESQGASQDEVQEYIDSVGPISPDVPSEQPQERKFFGSLSDVPKAITTAGKALKDVKEGYWKGAGATIAGTSELGEKILSLGKKGGEDTLGGRVLESGAVSPQTGAQRIGFGAEKIVELFAPTPFGKVGAGAKGFSAAAGRAGAMTAEGILKTGVQQGKIEGSDVAGQGLLNTALEFVASNAGPIGRFGAQVLGKTTGTSSAAVSEAFTNPNVVKFARQAAQKGQAGLLREALNDAKTGFTRMVEQRSKKYVSQLEKIRANADQMSEIRDNAVMQAQDAMQEAAVRLNKSGKMTMSSFRDSAIDQGKNAVTKAYRTLSTWKDVTPAGLDRLKKRLNQFRNSVKNSSDGSYQIIKSMSENVDGGLKAYVPGYQKMTDDYRKASDLLEQVDSALSPNAPNIDAAASKLVSALRENRDIRMEFLKTLQQKSGRDIVGKLAGAELSSAVPKGFAGRLATAAGPVGVIGAMANPMAWPALLVAAAATSPRLVAEASNAMSNAYRTGKFDVAGRTLRVILQRMMTDDNAVPE